jgi:hypothetical protein
MRAMPIATAATLVAFATAASRSAMADPDAPPPPRESFVDRPLTLRPFHFSADVGLGFGQGVTTTPDVQGNPTGLAAPAVQVGWGSSLEAAVGLPFIGEVGLRVGVRFGQPGIDAGWGLGADHFARLFDPVVDEPGSSGVTNPELRFRGTLFDLKVVELGLEARAIIPTASGSDFELTPGVPVRVHLPGKARIDTGVWLPIEFDSDASYTIDIPAQLFLQAGEAFFGPMLGFRFNHPGGSTDSTTDVPAGIAGGYTLGGVLDLKVQVRTERINDVSWTKYIGGGLGVGLRLP